MSKISAALLFNVCFGESRIDLTGYGKIDIRNACFRILEFFFTRYESSSDKCNGCKSSKELLHKAIRFSLHHQKSKNYLV